MSTAVFFSWITNLYRYFGTKNSDAKTLFILPKNAENRRDRSVTEYARPLFNRYLFVENCQKTPRKIYILS